MKAPKAPVKYDVVTFQKEKGVKQPRKIKTVQYNIPFVLAKWLARQENNSSTKAQGQYTIPVRCPE